MSDNEMLFNKYLNSINEILEQTVKFHLFSKYCQKIDFPNNKDYENYSTFIDNFFICSNYARISCLNKLIDQTGFSFFSLIDFIKSYPKLFNKEKENTLKELSEIEEKLKPQKKIIRTLVEQRNKFHAHLDIQAAGSDDMYNLFFEKQVTEEEIESLILTLCKCIIDINFIFNDTYEFNCISHFKDGDINLFEYYEIEKVFNLMKSSSQLSQPHNMSDMYNQNLTKKY
jgi:hypothetical protein